MMYAYLLSLHSIMRWLVLASLLYAIFRAVSGLRSGWTFTKTDDAARNWAATIAHAQMALGIWLYCISPVITYFFSDFSVAVKNRDVRFFGMEHSLMMVTAVVLITVGSIKVKRQIVDKQKFRMMLVWYVIALLVILSSIPWSFSPMVSRPLWRGF